jgi:hypothetical protein
MPAIRNTCRNTCRNICRNIYRNIRRRNGRRTHAWFQAAWLTAALALGASHAAHAQPMCFPSAGSVPGQPGLPDWWSVTPPADADDPRWRGCLSVDHSADQAQFRSMIQDVSATEKYLVLSWAVKVDPGFVSAGDVLYVGLYNEDAAIPANSKGNLIKISRQASTTTVAGPFGTAWTAALKYRDNTTSGGWSDVTSISPPIPSWLSADGRLDATCDGGSPPTCNQWLVRLRVKLNASGTTATTGASDPTAGIPVGTSFKMFWDLQVESSGLIIHHKWPYGPTPGPIVTDVDETASPPSYPALTTWGGAQFGASPPCLAGISIGSSQIDVVTTPATGSPHWISVTGTNAMHARPSNGTGLSQGGGAIKARFRVADWGSAVGDSPSWRTVTGCEAATGSGTVGLGGQWDLTCNWNGTGNLSPTEQCAYDPAHFSSCSPMPAQRYQHQCILVDLTAVTGPFVFSPASDYRNFDFVHASTFQRDARVDIAGLPAVGGGAANRDVYLYVETKNMPAVVDPSGGKGDGQNPGGLDPALRKRLELPAGPIDEKTAARLQSMVAAGQLRLADVEKIMPTYLVHVWHDTGKKNAAGAKIIEAQPSFGYFVSHDGALTGWKHQLAGKGVTLTAVPNSHDFYRLAVTEGGSAEITTTITSLPDATPTPPVSIPWWLILLLLLILLVVAILFRRKKAPPP